MTGTDPITTEIIRNAFLAAAEDMRVTLGRSAFSPVIYEAHDYSVALFNEKGEVLGEAPGLPFFLGGLDAAIHAVVDRFGLHDMAAGDAYIINDSYLTGSHLNDVDVLAPVVWQGEVIGFAVTRAHWRDLGASQPGYANDSREIYQEGLRLGPTRVARGGQFDQQILDILAYNSRLPHSLIGDLKAQVAACRMGERRYLNVVERFGLETVRSAMAEVFARVEALEREVVAAIPDGVYTAEGITDNDFHTDEPLQVKLKLTVQGSDLFIDTSGSSPQRAAPTNCGFAQTVSACRLAYKFLIRPDLGVTGGSFRPLRVHAEPGSIFAAQEPVGCLQYGVHTMLLVDLVIRALAPVLQDSVAAGLPGDPWNVILVGRLPDGQLWVTGESTAGGWGASSRGDGESAVIHSAAGDFRNMPAESLESRYPIRILRNALATDSGGPGRYRGGLGLVREYEMAAPANLTLWFDRTKMPSWGLFGGRSGSTPKVQIQLKSGEELHLNKTVLLPLSPGDRFTVWTGGGGGFGPVHERDPQAVARDVRAGYVSRERAVADYGAGVDVGT